MFDNGTQFPKINIGRSAFEWRAAAFRKENKESKRSWREHSQTFDLLWGVLIFFLLSMEAAYRLKTLQLSVTNSKADT